MKFYTCLLTALFTSMALYSFSQKAKLGLLKKSEVKHIRESKVKANNNTASHDQMMA